MDIRQLICTAHDRIRIKGLVIVHRTFYSHIETLLVASH